MKKASRIFTLLLTSFLLTGCTFTLNSHSNNSDTVDASSSDETSTDEKIDVTSVSLNKTSLFLAVGNSETLIATVSPSNATNKNVTFSSSDESVASVDDSGKVTALAVGSATITVKSSDGDFTASCSVTVIENYGVTKTEMKLTYDDYAANSAYFTDSCPTVGQPKLLIIPIWFTDSSNYISSDKKDNVKSDIETAYFGASSETGWRSVKTYYEELSAGKVSLTGTVSDWYEVNASLEEYGPVNAGGVLTNKLVATVTDWYFTNNPKESRTDYDTNGDGFLDGVMLIYGAPDCYSNSTFKKNGYGNLWAYCYWLWENESNITNPNPNAFFWASYDFMYSASKAKTRVGSNYGGGDTSHCNIDTHTYIHEMGHVFGLQDYYDYSNQCRPAGGFSMQDYNVGSHDAYSVLASGWADPYIPTESCEIVISTFQESKDLILLTPSWNDIDSPFDEYLLLELYSPTGLNEFDSTYQYNSRYPLGPDSLGIRLWHVDARLSHYTTYDDDEELSADNISVDPRVGTGSVHIMSNTYYKEDGEGKSHLSPLGKEYANYNLLQLIRNDKSETYQPTSYFTKSSLFKEGDSFSMDEFSSQFVNGTELNSGKSLGWSFTIKSMNSSQAIIELTKN